MADSYRPLFDGLKETAAALAQAGEASQQAIVASQLAIAALQRAGAGITNMADAVMGARTDHEDLRETVGRLETLVIAQGNDLRAVRERLNGGDHEY
jgi:hypothetical protein